VRWATRRRTRTGLGLWAAALLAGCTTVGVHTRAIDAIEYGPPQTVRVCLLKTADVPAARVDSIVAALNAEFGRYGLSIEVPWVRPWVRPGFQAGAIFEDLLPRELEPPCDRLFALVDRHAGDMLWGLVLPEVLGAVDTVTSTRGFVVATYASLNQVVAGPEAAAIHEFYHLLGCPHGMTLTACYPRIARLKAARDPAADFLPGVEMEQEKHLTTREAANSRLREWIAEQRANGKAQSPAAAGNADASGPAVRTPTPRP
jgi:hypothetical protein